MPNYQNGKIYKIYCNLTGETYYGSTCSELTKRVSAHKSDFKRWKNDKSHYIKSFDIIERGDCTYSLVEHFPCDSKIDLHARERYWIENNDCVNKVVPNRTKKEYCEQNKELKREQNKKYYEENRDAMRQQSKKNGEVKVICDCGSEVRKDSLHRHLKTKKHIAWVESTL